VQDVESVPIPVARYYTAVSGAVGGVHVRVSPFDQRIVDIRFFDKDGQNLGKAKERNVENAFFREDFRRVSYDDLGRIEEMGGIPERRYVEGALKALNVEAIRAAQFNLVVDYASAPTSLVLPIILNELGCTVIALNERMDETKMSVPTEMLQRGIDQLAAITASVKADLGARIDAGGERLWLVDGTGRKLSGTAAAAVFMELALRGQPGYPATCAVAVMANQPTVFEQIAARHGAQVCRTKIDPHDLMVTAADGGVILAFSGAGEFIVPSFHRLIDAMFPVAKMLEFLATQQTTLADVIAELPPHHVAQKRVPCPWEQKGMVMRLLNEQYREHIVAQADGLQIRLDDHNWVLIVPESDEPVFSIYTEASSDEDAAVLADRYARVIEGLRA
jgi:mannose-1-phosphate guanylyltransferase/phosphomannomutase